MDERYSHCFQTQSIWETGSDYQGRRSNSHIPQSTGINHFSQPRRFDGYAGEQGRLQHQHGLGFHPHSHPHSYSHSQSLALAQPHDLHEAIYREMEKERIRQEIIMSEILRRRALEVEVRMEMVMERELALGGSNTFPFGPLPPVGLDLPMRFPLEETRSRDERIVLSLSQRNNLSNRNGSDRSVPLQFQSASDDARVARNLEANPILEGEKQKITLQAKPIQNATVAKRARSGSDGKKAENEMSCALCQVSARSEQSLNDHLEGTRHKTKEAELRDQKTGKNDRIGLTTKKAAKPIQGSGPVDPSMQSETKSTSESLPFSKSGAKRARSGSDASGSQSDGKKAKKEMSCSLCQVSASSEQSLNGHLEGKRHKTKEAELRAQMTGKNFIIGLTTKKAAKPIQGSGPVDPSTQSETKITSESLPFSKSGDIARSSTDPSQKNLTSVKLEKKELTVPKQVKKKDNPENKNIRFWCEICQISVSNEKVMESHKTGKKHRRQLDKRNKCSGVGPSQKDAAVE